MDEAHAEDEEVQKDPDADEELSSTVVDHPMSPSFFQLEKLDVGRCYRCDRPRASLHEALEAAPFGFVTGKMGGSCILDDGSVLARTVTKVHAGRSIR